MNELALFAGGGGGILGGRLLGWRTRCAVELDPYARRILLARQRDGMLEPFPIWDDVKTFDPEPWKGIDVITGGWPCQDLSVGSGKGKGLDGERSGLWHEMARIIRCVRSRYVFAENSPALLVRGRGFDRVLSDLHEMGYHVAWAVLGADAVGLRHKRDRLWILASHAERSRLEPDERGGLYDRERDPKTATTRREIKPVEPIGSSWVPSRCELDREADGMATRMDKDRRRSLGNGQVPAVAALAWRILKGRIDGSR